MNVSNQIKNLEKEMGIHKNFWLRKCLFQDKLFQIGKNDKSYPDIHNLLIMCQLFKVSLDELVEDDLKNVQIKNIKKN